MLGRAEALYRRALADNPQDVDVLHMLGVVQMERMRHRDALDLLWDAAEQTRWQIPAIRHNLGLVLAKLLALDANTQQAELLERWVDSERQRKANRHAERPLVSVVLRVGNDVRYVRQAISSVGAQTYSRIELVVVDDGSTDETAAVVADVVSGLTIPVRFAKSENRGAPATMNRGAALARGRYLAFLDCDGHYTRDRIACMVDEIACTGAAWGFSLVANATDDPELGAADHAHGFDPVQRQRNYLGTLPNSFTLVEYNLVAAGGNLFVERGFFISLGGFRDDHHNHELDFGLRAAGLAEPVVVDRALYFHRARERNSIPAPGAFASEESDDVVAAFLATALGAGNGADGGAIANDLAPQAPANRDLLLRFAFRVGKGALVPVDALRSLAAALRTRERPALTEAAAGAPAGLESDVTSKTAIVVLGMHRSGTSALSRVLNLCGAFLPARVKPPKLGVNSKGFWEPEAVLDLNVRLMRQLGGEWDRIGFGLPEDGDVVAEFESDVRAVLLSEYGDQPMILIKDPRIGALAPLWDRALVRAGYRPVYVVPVRNPLEVARSLHARGDMSVNEGLALWLAYSQRIADFASSRADVAYLRFSDLLDDWRKMVSRVAEQLDVPLNVRARADEVDAFLEPQLRRHSTDAAALEAQVAGLPVATGVLDVYRASLERCERGMRDGAGVEWGPAAATSVAAGVGTGENAVGGTGEDRPATAPPSATFVLCIENNAIRDQALLLCRSIRRFAGRYRDAPILAYAPRPGLGVDRATRIALETLQVEYVELPLNTRCQEYPPANRVFAGAHAEQRTGTDFLVVLDSDTVWLDEPQIPVDVDAAVRIVDAKGSATRGPGDRFEPYWAALATMSGTPLERLPFVTTTLGGERIRASYNGGLAMLRRRCGMLTRCAEIFAGSLRMGLKPYLGAGIEIVASTGAVGTAGSEYWGSSQTALALAIWGTTERILHLPDCYNLPLHLIAASSEIDPRWLARIPVHVHYHWMLGLRHRDVAIELLGRLGVRAEQRAWLARWTPLAGDAHGTRAKAAAA